MRFLERIKKRNTNTIEPKTSFMIYFDYKSRKKKILKHPEISGRKEQVDDEDETNNNPSPKYT